MQIGYLHRCFEKECEHATWTQVFPYTDRLNYVSPMLNNVGFALAVEKLLGIAERDPRARAVHPRDRRRAGAHHRPPDLHRRRRRWSSARSRRSSACIKAREWIWELLEEVTGARLTHSYGRVGGMAKTCPTDFDEQAARHASTRSSAVLVEVERAARREPHLPRPHGRHRRSSRRRTRIASAGPARACARPASPTTCARTTRTSSTTASTSTSRSARRATTSTASSCASRRCGSRCASSSRRSSRSPTGPVMRRRSAHRRCRPRATSTTRSRR